MTITARMAAGSSAPAGPVGSVTGRHMRGGIDLQVSPEDYRSRVDPPSALNTIRTGADWRFFPTDMGGGLRGGDRIQHTLELTRGARVLWTPPAATLCYSEAGGTNPAEMVSRVVLAPGSRLVALNPACIPCGRAWISQSSDLLLAEGSGLLWFDLWSSGRETGGEGWGLHQLDVSISLHLGDQTFYRERWTLGSEHVPAGRPGFSDYGTLWTVVWRREEGDGWDPRAAVLDHVRAMGGVAEWGRLGGEVMIMKGLTPRGRSALPPLTGVL